MCLFTIILVYGPFVTLEFYQFKQRMELYQLNSSNVIGSLNTKLSNLTFVQKEAVCLAENIYFEAGSESLKGKEAVAAVTLNRVKDSRFPKTTCGVVYQNNKRGCQFSWTCDGKPNLIRNEKSFGESLNIAQDYLLGRKKSRIISSDVVYYHANYVKPEWAKEKHLVTSIGAHIFYK
jgi:spore germination cell wall hydrolase CwlJ-like protein